MARLNCGPTNHVGPYKTRKRFHLAKDNYVGRRTYFITLCTTNRASLFLERNLAEKVISILKEDASRMAFLLHAWCLMPDHLHFLTEGADETADLFQFVTHFKQRTTASFTGPRTLWQRNFYEHILRSHEKIGRVANYIWMNPVRKGLCEFVNEHPYSGSLTMPWTDPVQDPWIPPWKKSIAARRTTSGPTRPRVGGVGKL